MLELVPLAPVHAASLQELLADEELRRSVGYESPFAADWAERYVRWRGDERRAGRIFTFALRSVHGVVGSSSLHGVDWRERSAKIGFWLGRAHRGHGHGSQAVRLTLDFARERLALLDVVAECRADNTAAQATVARCGFTLESSTSSVFRYRCALTKGSHLRPSGLLPA